MSSRSKKKHHSASTNQNPPPAPEKSKGLWWVIGLIFISGVGLGFGVGRARSPDYTDPREARRALEDWTLERTAVRNTQWTKNGSLLRPGIVELNLVSGEVGFECGYLRYPESPASSNDTVSHIVSCPLSHTATNGTGKQQQSDGFERTADLQTEDHNSTDAGTLPELLRHTWHDYDVPREGLSFKESLEIIVGESAGVGRTLLDTRQYWLERRGRGWISKLRDGTVMVTSVVTGYALGYYWGYRNNPKCGASELQPQFKSLSLQNRIRARLFRLYRYRFTVDSKGVIQNVESNMSPEPNLRDVYLPLRAAGLLDCRSGGIRISDSLHQDLQAHSYELFRHAHAPIWIKVSDLLWTMFNSSPVIGEYIEDGRYYGFEWWRQLPDHTWEPVQAQASFIMGSEISRD
jgi:hypothetical protein